MTLAQLMTLADRHRLATGSTAHEDPAMPAPGGGGMGLLGMAAMGAM